MYGLIGPCWGMACPTLVLLSPVQLRDEYTNHCLHLNWRGKGKLTHLIAKKLGDDHVSGISNIHVITHARDSPFLD
jgi:hypothetical protein